MEHVLVIDDDRAVLAGLHDALMLEGYRVTAAASSFEALDLLETDPPDLVTLDLRMPQVSGLELLKAIRRCRPQLPVVVCTGLFGYRDDYDVLHSNVVAFLQKPIDLEELCEAVREIIGQDSTQGVFPSDSAEDTLAVGMHDAVEVLD